jgi:hypothetical protein
LLRLPCSSIVRQKGGDNPMLPHGLAPHKNVRIQTVIWGVQPRNTS